jgi:adenylyl-sulfate kinase
VIWLFGLSGSGKTTLSNLLAAGLHTRGILSTQLDGDDLRSGLSRGLGFSDVDRTENLRRAAEVARIMVNSGNVVICSFITPFRTQRDLVRRVIGDSDLSVVHVAATLEVCMQRDPKGLYSQAKAGRLPGLTGYEARFEEPTKSEVSLTVNTVGRTAEDCASELMRALLPVIRPAG